MFKTVTGDNGSEFATLADFEKYGMSVYFTHPYTSCEKGTNECHNKMLRRFIPKGKPISSYTAEDMRACESFSVKIEKEGLLW